MATDNIDHISCVLKELENQDLAGRFDPAYLHTFSMSSSAGIHVWGLCPNKIHLESRRR